MLLPSPEGHLRKTSRLNNAFTGILFINRKTITIKVINLFTTIDSIILLHSVHIAVIVDHGKLKLDHCVLHTSGTPIENDAALQPFEGPAP